MPISTKNTEECNDWLAFIQDTKSISDGYTDLGSYISFTEHYH